MYEELVKECRDCLDSLCGECKYEHLQKPGNFVPCMNALLRETADAIEEAEMNIRHLERDYKELCSYLPEWIPVTEKLPKCEQEVLISTEKKLVGRDAYIDSIVTPAIYEDGTMRENDSIWRWEDIDWAGWDEEEDCGIIPEGWWENRHFNPDDVYNNPVDRKVVAWMPMPESYKPPKEKTK